MKMKKNLAIILSLIMLVSMFMSVFSLSAVAEAPTMPTMPVGNTNYAGNIDFFITPLGSQSNTHAAEFPEATWDKATQTLTMNPKVDGYNYNLRTFYQTTLGVTSEDYAIEFDVDMNSGDNRLEIMVGAGPEYWRPGPVQILLFAGPGGVASRVYDRDLTMVLADAGLGNGLKENALNHVTLLFKEGRYLTMWIDGVLMDWGTAYDLGAGCGSNFGIKANYSENATGNITVNNIKQYKLAPEMNAQDPNEPKIPVGNTNYAEDMDLFINIPDGFQSNTHPAAFPEAKWNADTQTLTMNPTANGYNYSLRTFYPTDLVNKGRDYAIDFDVYMPAGDNRLEVMLGAGPDWWTAGPVQVLFFTGPGGVATRLYTVDLGVTLADTGLGHGLKESALNHVTIELKEGRYLTVWVNGVKMDWGSNTGFDIGADRGTKFGIKANYSANSSGFITVNNIKQYLTIPEPAMPTMPLGNTNHAGNIDLFITPMGQQSIDNPNPFPEATWDKATQTLTMNPSISQSVYNYSVRTFYPTTLANAAQDYAIEFDVTMSSGDNRLEVMVGAGPDWWTPGPVQILFYTGPGGVATRLYDVNIENMLADTGLGYGLKENALNHVTILLKEGRYLTVWVNGELMDWGNTTYNGGYDIGANRGSKFGIKANQNGAVSGNVIVNNIKQYVLEDESKKITVAGNTATISGYKTATEIKAALDGKYAATDFSGVTTVVVDTCTDMDGFVSNGNSLWNTYFSAVETIDLREAPLTALSAGLFKNCTTAKTVYLPNGLETIGAEAFAGVNGVSVVIPATVKTVDANAFKDATALTLTGNNTAVQSFSAALAAVGSCVLDLKNSDVTAETLSTLNVDKITRIELDGTDVVYTSSNVPAWAAKATAPTVAVKAGDVTTYAYKALSVDNATVENLTVSGNVAYGDLTVSGTVVVNSNATVTYSNLSVAEGTVLEAAGAFGDITTPGLYVYENGEWVAPKLVMQGAKSAVKDSTNGVMFGALFTKHAVMGKVVEAGALAIPYKHIGNDYSSLVKELNNSKLLTAQYDANALNAACEQAMTEDKDISMTFTIWNVPSDNETLIAATMYVVYEVADTQIIVYAENVADEAGDGAGVTSPKYAFS